MYSLAEDGNRMGFRCLLDHILYPITDCLPSYVDAGVIPKNAVLKIKMIIIKVKKIQLSRGNMTTHHEGDRIRRFP